MSKKFHRDLQYYKFCTYGFLKNLRFFEPFLILFFVEKGLTYFQIGTLYAVREVSTNILEVPTGIIADSFGRRRTMIYSFISYIFSFLIFFYSGKYLLFIPAMLLFSFGEAFRTGTHKAMIFDYLVIKGWDDQKVYYYGHTRSWSQIGSAISSLIAAYIVFYSGSYSHIFLYSTIPYVFDLFLVITYPKELDGPKRHLHETNVKQYFFGVIKEFFHSFKNKNILRAITNVSVFSGFHRATKDYLQPILSAFALSLPLFLYLKDNQRSALVIGTVYFIIFMLTSIASRRSGKSAERFRHITVPLNITMTVGFLMGVLIGFFYDLQLTIISILLFIGIYLIQNLRKPMGIAYISDMMPQSILATALSAESQITTLFTAVIAVFIGFCADHFGIGNAMVIISVTLLLMTPICHARDKKQINRD